MEKHLCQSCGINMDKTKEAYGTNADGSLSADYCHYCYSSGVFTADLSMNDVIGHWIIHVAKEYPGLSEKFAREKMEALMRSLKRWSA